MEESLPDASTVPARGKILIPARVSFAIFGAMSMAITYGHKVCISVALVSMINHTALHQEQYNTEDSPINITIMFEEDGPFIWNGHMQSWIISSYFIGYFSCQCIGGYIAQYSAKWTIFFTIAINGICCTLTPLLSYWHWITIVVLRVLQGIGGAVSLPAMHVMLSKWSPILERSRMSSLVYSGTVLGSVLSTSLTGLMASKLSWQAPFYVFGSLSLAWLVFWVVLIQDSPATQPFISQDERDKIMQSLKTGPKKAIYRLPWKKVFASKPFIGLALAHFCTNCGWYMILIELPFYFKKILNFSLSQNAIFTSLPFLTMYFFGNICGNVLDHFIVKEKFTITTARKIATLIGLLGPALSLGILCIKVLGTNKYMAVFLLTLATTSFGAVFSGVLLNHLDIASHHAGILMAITNTIATVPAITIPFVFDAMTKKNDKSFEEWRGSFCLVIGFLACGAVAYPILGSAEEQPWNQEGKIES